jgi:amino acid adenylation domain-containing protein
LIDTNQTGTILDLLNPAGPVRKWPAMRVHECFELLADRQPEAPAILSGAGVITYSGLDQQANALAHALLDGGVVAEEAVGVLTARSGSLPAAFLGILKAGAAYVPMGADHPPQRLASIAAQSHMRHLVVLDGLEPPAELLAALAADATVRRPENVGRSSRRPFTSGRPSDLAAILFTSGSTGNPKGVLLQHDACVNMAFGHIEAHQIGPDDRSLLATAPGFILGFRELCVPLLAGAAFVPASREMLDNPKGLLAAMSHHRVTVAMFTPSYLRLFDRAVPDGLRCLLTAGERPNAADAREYARRLDYWNVHGSTEVCGAICMSRVNPDGEGPLPSGRPFTNTTVCLLDADGDEVPPGEVGEIHVAGAGVARGYLNQPGLTADRFVQTRFGRAYRSGDLGRWNDEGELECVGRADDVVKVSGQSVSLGEIEQTLMRHDLVRLAVAIQHEGRLLAFVESDGGDADTLAYWHAYLGETLPGYMLPAQVTSVSKLPRGPHGKVDRQSLAALAAAVHTSPPAAGELPQGEREQQIARVWEEVLRVCPILREDHFFAVGGTSLLAIAVSQRLQALGYAASPQTILVAGTIASLAERIVFADGPQTQAPAAREGVATVGQQDFWIASKLGLGANGSQITRILAVRGPVPEPPRWQSAWTQLVERHAALRTVFFADHEGQVHWRTADVEELVASLPISIEHCDSPEDARECIDARANQPWVLTQAPLARAGLVHFAGETVFWFAVHHAVVDGFSARTLQDELYALLTEGQLSPAPNGVAQASEAEQKHLASEATARDRSYWQHKLDSLVARGGEAFHEFSTGHNASSTGGCEPVTERLDGTALEALTRMAQNHHVGLHALLLTLLAAETRRRDPRSDLIIGAGISVRPPGANDAVGYFVNLLPVALEQGKEATFSDRMRAAQTALTEAVEHGTYPSSLIYREFRQRHPDARPHSRNSLFDISLTTNPSRVSSDPGREFFAGTATIARS